MRVGIPPWLLLLFFLFFSLSSSHVRPETGGVEVSDPDLHPNPVWQVLSKKNFSSEIRLHSHILLLVTVPWSGEARSLMKEIQRIASIDKTQFSELKLMVVYRNSEKMIADMLGASEGTKVVYYRNSTPLKYNGKLRALNVLSSVSHTMSLQEDEIPFKSLSEIIEIEDFVEPTEKSVFLIELCDWSTKLMRQNNESYEKVVRDAYNSVELLNTKDKIMDNEELYGADVSISLWDQLGLTSASQNASEETLNHEKGSKCTKEEFEKFQSFYKDFVSIAKENFLPSEKQKFGLVTNKSLLNYLGVNNVETWAVLVQYSFCPDCSVLVRESKELRTILQGHHPLVKELETDDQNREVSFPVNRPSLVLFTDTSSQNPQIRSESKLALEIIRKYAWQNRNFITPPKISPKMPTNRDPSEPKTMKINDDIIVINQNNQNEGNGNNIMDVLAKLIQQTRDGKDKNSEVKKISVVAKELGFQLLSEDFSVKIGESNNLSLTDETDINEGLNTENDIISEFIEENEPSNMNYVNNEVENNSEEDNNEAQIEEMKEEISSDSDEKIASESVQSCESETDLINDNNNKSNNNQYFMGSIYFSNGYHQLLKALTSDSNFPSLLIINPITQKHYIYSDETPITYSSLENFINNFLNQSLAPYIKSDPLARTSKEIPKPPFVNLDFHEADSIPRVSADEFCESVLGFENCLNNFSERNLSLESFGDAWERDVLVLFSNSWCGFCQKMEFVLREVFRAFKHFVKETEIEEQKENFSLNDLPSIYLMDCTRNDCSPFLSSEKMELYPSLFLFPAKSKKYISYQGAASVLNIFEFLHAHLNNFKKYKGILWTHVRETKINIPKSIQDEISSTIQAHKISRTDTKLEISSEKINNKNYKYKITVGSTLSATDQLSNSSPFYNSTILIVSTNSQDGFQGVIFNKPINWNIFKDPNGDLEPIKNTPIFYGGPISHPGFPLVSLSDRIIEGFVEVINGVYFGNGVVTNNAIKRIKNGDELSDGFWFFFGYSGWGFEQLFDELDKGVWDLSESLIESLDWPISSK